MEHVPLIFLFCKQFMNAFIVDCICCLAVIIGRYKLSPFRKMHKKNRLGDIISKTYKFKQQSLSAVQIPFLPMIA